MKRYCGSIRVQIKSMLVLTAVFAVASATFTSFAIAKQGPSSINNGGGTPSCGNSCDSAGNPTDFHQPCTPVPGNGCHTLPDTPCERGHGNAEEHNKHCAPAPSPPPGPKIFLGYADTFHPLIPFGLPTPWKGSPGVIFVGCGVNPNGGGPAADTCPQENGGDAYDAGAIRIDNTSATDSLVVTGPASVNIGSCVYAPWSGLNITIPPGGTLILTQTGLTADPCGVIPASSGNFNFDTSESSGYGHCNAPSASVPVITLTLNGSPTTINDSAQILNTQGIDKGTCTAANEFQEWTAVP